MAEPFAFAEYRKKRLREKIDEKRDKSRVPLPVSDELFLSHSRWEILLSVRSDCSDGEQRSGGETSAGRSRTDGGDEKEEEIEEDRRNQSSFPPNERILTGISSLSERSVGAQGFAILIVVHQSGHADRRQARVVQEHRPADLAIA